MSFTILTLDQGDIATSETVNIPNLTPFHAYIQTWGSSPPHTTSVISSDSTSTTFGLTANQTFGSTMYWYVPYASTTQDPPISAAITNSYQYQTAVGTNDTNLIGLELLVSQSASFGHTQAAWYINQQSKSNDTELIDINPSTYPIVGNSERIRAGSSYRSAYKLDTPIDVDFYLSNSERTASTGSKLGSGKISHVSELIDDGSPFSPYSYYVYFESPIPKAAYQDNSSTVFMVAAEQGDGSVTLEISASEIASKTGTQTATALIEDFGLSHDTGEGCTESSFTNLTEREENLLKRAYVYKAAGAGHTQYKTIVDNLSGAITVSKLKLKPNGNLGTGNATFSPGDLAQYKIQLNNTNFSSVAATTQLSAVASEIVGGIATNIMNLSPGMGDVDLPDVSEARTSFTEPSITTTVIRSCCDALVSGVASVPSTRAAGVYRTNDVIDQLAVSDDGGQYLANMLSGIKTIGNSSINVVHVTGGAAVATMYIGIRRGLQDKNNPANNENLAGTVVQGKTVSVDDVNAIAEAAKDSAIGLLKRKLLNTVI